MRSAPVHTGEPRAGGWLQNQLAREAAMLSPVGGGWAWALTAERRRRCCPWSRLPRDPKQRPNICLYRGHDYFSKLQEERNFFSIKKKPYQLSADWWCGRGWQTMLKAEWALFWGDRNSGRHCQVWPWRWPRDAVHAPNAAQPLTLQMNSFLLCAFHLHKPLLKSFLNSLPTGLQGHHLWVREEGHVVYSPTCRAPNGPLPGRVPSPAPLCSRGRTQAGGLGRLSTALIGPWRPVD